MITATQKLEKINSALSSGATVYVHTMTRVTKVTPKTAAAWEKAGRPIFKTDGKSLYIGAGKRYDCIDYTAITVQF